MGRLIRRFLPEKARHGAHALRGILAYDRGRRRSMLRGPLGVQIQTIDRCNAACLMCPYATTAHQGPAHRMDDALYTHILRGLRRTGVTQSVCLMLQNDPLLDRRLPDLVRRAKETIPGIRVTTVTNAALLTPQRIDALRASGLDWVAVSIDAASEATYRRVRCGLDFATVVANTETLLRRGGPIKVTARFLRQRENQGEERAFATYWRARGARINFNPLTNRAGELATFEALRVRARPLRAAASAVLNRIIPFCPLPFVRVGILWDGRVILCCHDWGPREVMGDLSRQSVEEVWNGEVINRHRSLLLARRSEASAVCRGCSLARGFWNT